MRYLQPMSRFAIQKQAEGFGDAFSGFLDPIKDFAEAHKDTIDNVMPYVKTFGIAAIPALAHSMFSRKKAGESSSSGWLWALPLAAVAGHGVYNYFQKNVNPLLTDIRNTVNAAKPFVMEHATKRNIINNQPIPEGADTASVNKWRKDLWNMGYFERKKMSKIYGGDIGEWRSREKKAGRNWGK